MWCGFAYPYGAGAYVGEVRQAAREAGYRYDFGIKQGISPFPWDPKSGPLKRLIIRGDDSSRTGGARCLADPFSELQLCPQTNPPPGAVKPAGRIRQVVPGAEGRAVDPGGLLGVLDRDRDMIEPA